MRQIEDQINNDRQVRKALKEAVKDHVKATLLLNSKIDTMQ